MSKAVLPKNFGKRRTGEGNKELANMLANGELREVDLNLVDRDDGQPRPLSEVLDGIEAFADELERDDFVLAQYPVYHIEENGRFTIVVGERRTTAFRMKGRESIPAVCKKFSDEERKKIFVMQYAENDGKLKKLLSPVADAKWWKTFIDRFHGGNVAAAAKERGRTESDISNRLAILDAPTEILDFAASSGLKDPATLAGLVRLAKRGGIGIVQQIIADFNAGEIKGSFRNHVSAMSKLLNKNEDTNAPVGKGTSNSEISGTPSGNKKEPKKENQQNSSLAAASNSNVTGDGVQNRAGATPLTRAIDLLDKARLASDLLDADQESTERSLKEIIQALNEAQASLKASAQMYKAELLKIKQAAKNDD